MLAEKLWKAVVVAEKKKKRLLWSPLHQIRDGELKATQHKERSHSKGAFARTSP